MLFAYRAGKTPISAKAWAKLADAESEIPEKSGIVRSYGDPNEFSSVLRDDVAEYRFTKKPPEKDIPKGDRIALLELAVNSMDAQLQVMRELIQTLKTTL